MGECRKCLFSFGPRKLLKFLCDGGFLDIDFTPQHGFEFLDSLRKGFEVYRFSGGEARRSERRICREWDSCLRILIVPVAARLVGDLNCSCTEQNGQDEADDVGRPSIAQPAEVLGKSGASYLVPIGMLAFEIG